MKTQPVLIHHLVCQENVLIQDQRLRNLTGVDNGNGGSAHAVGNAPNINHNNKNQLAMIPNLNTEMGYEYNLNAEGVTAPVITSELEELKKKITEVRGKISAMGTEKVTITEDIATLETLVNSCVKQTVGEGKGTDVFANMSDTWIYKCSGDKFIRGSALAKFKTSLAEKKNRLIQINVDLPMANKELDLLEKQYAAAFDTYTQQQVETQRTMTQAEIDAQAKLAEEAANKQVYMSKTKRYMLFGGIAVLLLAGIYFMTRKSKTQ